MAKQTFTTGQVLTAAQMTSLQQTAMGGGSTTAKTASYVLVAADAGTVVQINAAGATTITVNTALFAAGDVVFLQNIGAGVCTITAGTATVSTAGSLALTQFEGGQLYFTAAGASVFFDYIQAGTTLPLTTKGDLFGFDTANARIPIGLNNTVLTADSAQALGLKWATAATGVVDYSLISSSTVISVSSLTFSSLTSYNNLIILFGDCASTLSGTTNYLTINGSSTALDYERTGLANNPGSTYTPSSIFTSVSTLSAGDSNGFVISYGQAAGDVTNGYIQISGCKSSNKKMITQATASNGTSSQGFVGGGVFNGSAVSSITIQKTGGLFNGGRIRLYGSTN